MATPIETIGKVTLHQKAWVVAKLQFVYLEGSVWKHVDGSGGTALGQSVTCDPGDYGVPNGAQFAVYVFVVWGNDRQGREVFRYEKGNTRTASYTLTGTTLDASLSFDGITNA